jgi:carboxymethylenebutenolidase
MSADAEVTMRTRPSQPAVAALLLVVGLWAGCGSPDTAAAPETGEEAEDAMAQEHEGDRPEASEAAEAAPAEAATGDPVVYATLDGHEVTGYLARPAESDRPLPGLIVIHEWWGLNDNIQAMARRLAGEGYVALAVDLYGGQVAESPETARELVSQVDPDRALRNLQAARSHLSERLAATGGLPDRIGVIGWCFGGGWSLQAALAMPEEIDAAVVYYGRPVTERAELEGLQAPLLGIFGAEDGSIPVEVVREMEATLQGLGKSVEVHVYEGAGHAFANPSGTRYQPEAAEAAWSETVEFLGEHLPPGTPAEGGP